MKIKGDYVYINKSFLEVGSRGCISRLATFNMYMEIVFCTQQQHTCTLFFTLGFCFYCYSLNGVCWRQFLISTNKSNQMVFKTRWKFVIVLLRGYVCHLSLSLYNVHQKTSTSDSDKREFLKERQVVGIGRSTGAQRREKGGKLRVCPGSRNNSCS